MANSSQLYLLADHIKLSLLERQRAISLNIEPNSQDGHISRSLESLREGIETLEVEQTRLSKTGDTTAASTLKETTTRLRTQHDDLTAQFRGFPSAPPHPPLKDPPPPSSLRKLPSPNPSKSVRFRDSPESPDPNRDALFPYRDDPSPPNPTDNLENPQLLQHHTQIMREQDDQLDRLGESIGRQRDLSIQIGDELDEHVAMLEDVEGGMDRQQGMLDGAQRRVGGLLRRGRENKGGVVIAILVLILVILVIVLKS